jgi:hypothetical protein
MHLKNALIAATCEGTSLRQCQPDLRRSDGEISKYNGRFTVDSHVALRPVGTMKDAADFCLEPLNCLFKILCQKCPCLVKSGRL